MSQKAILKKEGEYFFKGEFLKAGAEFEVKEIRGVNTWCFIDGELYPFRTVDVLISEETNYLKGLCSISKKLSDDKFLNVSKVGSSTPYMGVIGAETNLSITYEAATEKEFNEAFIATAEKLNDLSFRG